MIVTTRATAHLLKRERHIPVTVGHFKDGELYVKVRNANLKNKQVALIGAFPPPAENVLELVLLLDALKRLGASVHLIITYFGYARQDSAEPGEALAGEVMASLFAKADKVTVIDPHNDRLRRFLAFNSVVPITPFLPFIKSSNLVVVAPDAGAVPRARRWQELLDVPIAFLEKSRPAPDVARTLSVKGDVKDKNVLLVDDVISTGGTVISAANFLKKQGAKSISVAATHGVFAQNALSRLAKSPIRRILVTNSMPQKSHRLLKVVSIDSLLQNLVKGP